jgi:hypothetical protein
MQILVPRNHQFTFLHTAKGCDTGEAGCGQVACVGAASQAHFNDNTPSIHIHAYMYPSERQL